MADIWDVDDWVDVIATMPIKRFYPTAVAKSTTLPLDRVYERLLKLVKDEVLFQVWEIRCTNYDCVRTIDALSSKPGSTPTSIICDTCQSEIEVDANNLFPSFGVTDNYKTRMRSKKKSSGSHRFSRTDVLKAMKEPAEALPVYLTPEVVQALNALGASGSNVTLNIVFSSGGDVLMTTNNNPETYRIDKIEAPNGAVQVGGQNNKAEVTNYHGGGQALSPTEAFVEELKKLDMPEEEKEQLVEAVKAATQEVEKEKPNKMVLSGLLDSIGKAIDLVAKTPALVDAYHKWQGVFS